MLRDSETKIKLQVMVNGTPINTVVPLDLVAYICEEDTFRNELSKTFEFGDTTNHHFEWTYEPTESLINKYKLELENLNNPEKEKYLIWAKIANEMTKEGYKVNGYLCEKKFQTLRNTYQLIKQIDDPETKNQWDYYKLMDGLYTSTNELNSTTSFTRFLKEMKMQKLSFQTYFCADIASDTSMISQSSERTFSEELLKEIIPKWEEKVIENENCLGDGFRDKIMEIESQRIEEFRRFNDIYQRIATAMEEKNDLYRKYLSLKE